MKKQVKPALKDFVKKEINILQSEMKTRFGGVEDRFDGIDKRFDIIDKKFDNIDKKFDNIDKKFNYIDKKFDIFDKRFDFIDNKFEEMETIAEKRYNKVMEQLVDIAGQFQKFDEERLVLAHRQSDHSDRIERLEKAVFKTS